MYYSKAHTIPTITTATSAPLTRLTVTTITTTACYFLYNIHTPFCSLVPYLIPPGNCRLVGPQWPALSIRGEWGLEARTGRSSLKLQGGPWESRVKKKNPEEWRKPTSLCELPLSEQSLLPVPWEEQGDGAVQTTM